jgi:hypothetical protein
MRLASLFLATLSLTCATPAFAAQGHAARPSAAHANPPPKEIGQFTHWIAATHTEAGQLACYAFTRAGNEDPATGTGPVLSVADRPSGRDVVAISGGPAFAKGSTLSVQVDHTALDFYTAGHDAFARDNKAAVAAFARGTTAVAHVPQAHGTSTLTFGLDGFSAAHEAMSKACPAQ